LALRLLIPKEKLSAWIPKAELALLKGLGVENLRLLEGVGVDSVQKLAAETPENLYKKMLRLYKNKRIPSEAKIHIWIREARRYARTP
jgi:predicted RecB family nuclease